MNLQNNPSNPSEPAFLAVFSPEQASVQAQSLKAVRFAGNLSYVVDIHFDGVLIPNVGVFYTKLLGLYIGVMADDSPGRRRGGIVRWEPAPSWLTDPAERTRFQRRAVQAVEALIMAVAVVPEEEVVEAYSGGVRRTPELGYFTFTRNQPRTHVHGRARRTGGSVDSQVSREMRKSGILTEGRKAKAKPSVTFKHIGEA